MREYDYMIIDLKKTISIGDQFLLFSLPVFIILYGCFEEKMNADH